MDKIKLTSAVTNGKISGYVAHQLRTIIGNLEGKSVRITLEEAQRTRSHKQNAYYWGVVVPLVLKLFLEAGNDTNAEEVHYYLKEHVGFLVKNLSAGDGEFKQVVTSSANIETAAFEEYLERIRAWAATYGVQIPLPNEKLQFNC